MPSSHPSPVSTLSSELSDPAAYERAFDALSKRQRRRGRAPALVHGGPSLVELGYASRELARLLARTVAAGDFRFSPVSPRTVLVDGKERVLYAASVLDHAVLSALASVLAVRLEPCLSESLHSYRPGRSLRSAHAALREYLCEHRRSRPSPCERGLYVLRRDLRAYGDSIAVDDTSALWRQLEEALPDLSSEWLAFVQSALRPRVDRADGEAPDVLSVGVPAGSPCQPLVCNLYCSPMDLAIADLEGGLYLRYGDDVLFAHPDPRVADEAGVRLDAQARALRLTWNEEKSARHYFTGPGRRSKSAPGYAPTRRVEFLGLSVSFDGTRRLKEKRRKQLFVRLEARMRHAIELVGRGGPLEERGGALCEALGRALDPRDPLCDPLAPLLAFEVDDRGELKQLDDWLGLRSAEQITGWGGPRAFRRAPPRSLRRWGLPSLVQARNSGHR